MLTPLTVWQLHARQLPNEMTQDVRPAPFSLPGASALSDFADLLGDAPEEDAQETDGESAPFSLPAMIPEGVCGECTLTRVIDFGALRGDRAVLTLESVLGRGEVLLGETAVASFDSVQPSLLSVDLTDALDLGRRETLALRFDETRPAGVCGPVLLRAARHALIAGADVLPNARAQTMALCVRVEALRPGTYVLRAQAAPPDAAIPAPPAREVSFSLAENKHHEARFSMEVEAPAFLPGTPYAAPAIKLQLFWREHENRAPGALCDDAVFSCGYPARERCAFVPLDNRALSGDPRALAQRLGELGVRAVSLGALAPDAVYRTLARAGIAALHFAPLDSDVRKPLARHPNVLFSAAPLGDIPAAHEAQAWQLCAMTAYPRPTDETATPAELLAEAAGRALDTGAERVQGALSWLCAVGVRLRAEAARQGRYAGPLCAPGAHAQADVADALRAAFAPLHLSALPLYGAWWSGTRFSASLHAFLPEGEAPLTALAVLEDEDGRELARLQAPCAGSGEIGVLEAALPDEPCVLTLSCRLMRGEETLEQSALPVYVGTLGPLEAAF